MKAKLLPYILRYGPIVNLLGIVVLLILVIINTHWSVAALLAWMAYTITGFANGMGKFRRDFNKKIKAVRQEAKEGQSNFDQFIGTVNKQAQEFKQHGNKCIECEKYPGQVRNGSIHNSADPNCQMHMTAEPMKQVPPELLKENTRPMCSQCKDEGRPDLHYQNNCPIHD